MLILKDDLFKIMDCIRQHINHMRQTNFNINEFHVIRVWYYDMANLILKTNIGVNDFSLYTATEMNYTNQDIINKAKNIWSNDLIPIEILKDNDGYFFSLPKEIYKEELITDYCFLPSEYEIPDSTLLNEFTYDFYLS